MLKHILLSVDLNQESSWKKALPCAINMCRENTASLHILTVIPDFGMSIVGQQFPEGYEKKIAEQALVQLREFVDKHVPDDLQVQHIVGEGTVYEVILKIAEDINADMIIVASHRPKLKDYLLGPNAARVVRHATCSVMVVRD